VNKIIKILYLYMPTVSYFLATYT